MQHQILGHGLFVTNGLMKASGNMASAEFLSSYWNPLFTIRQDAGVTIKGKRPILETDARPILETAGYQGGLDCP